MSSSRACGLGHDHSFRTRRLEAIDVRRRARGDARARRRWPGSSPSGRWTAWTWAPRPSSARSRLRRRVGRDDGGDDAAGRRAGRRATRPCRRPRCAPCRCSSRPTLPSGARRRRGVRGLPAARRARRRRGGHRRGRLRAHAAQAALPATLPGERPLRIRVRALLRRLEHRPDADAGGARRHEHHLDGRDRRARRRPEAAAREGRRSTCRWRWRSSARRPDRHRALVGPGLMPPM